MTLELKPQPGARTGNGRDTPDGGAALLTIAARRAAGHGLRKLVPRSLHAAWTPPIDRRDPVQMLTETGRHRIPALLPVRHARMRPSAFTFLRGAAAVMAADLASTPSSGLRVQASGDAHHANFGIRVTPDDRAVWDISDFDETLPAPFEWDLKRLATSLAVDARGRGAADKVARGLARMACLAYRVHMAALVRLDPLDAWRSRVDLADAIATVDDERLRDRELRRMNTVLEANRRGFPRLLERRRTGWNLRERAPVVMPLSGRDDDTHEVAARTAFASYRATLPAERRPLLARYRLADVAFKTTGIASVGTFCAIGLFVTADEETLLLQIREAQPSALAPYAGASEFRNQGHRVVAGQRVMQCAGDIFLGWTQDAGDDRPCHVRRMADPRLALLGAEIGDSSLAFQATLCGRALARAHARSGDAARISGYMGSGGVMDAAIADFAMAYADQTGRDWRLFEEAIKSGVIEAHDP